MLTPTKMSEKNTRPEKRSVRVTAKSSKRSSAGESSKNSVPAIERMVSDKGLKRKQGEMDVKDSKKLISAVKDNISKAEEVFHNIVMRLTDHSGMSDALWFELGEDLGKFSINKSYLITGMKCVGSTHLPMVESRLISRYFSTLRGVSRENLELQMSNAKFDNNDDAVNIPGYPHALLVWAYETLPLIASKFTTKYDQAIPRMMSWTTADNVKFDDVLVAFTMVGESQGARLYLKNPKAVPQLPPPKSSVPRPSTDTKSEWREFQKEIRGQVASLNNKLEDLKKEQKNSNKLLRRVLKMLSANMIKKGQGKAQTTPHVSNSQEINVQRAESDVLQTTSPDIGAVADMGVQAVMEFLTADKVIVSHEEAENEKNKVNIKDHLEGNEGEANVKSEPFVEIKEESMPNLEKGVKEEKDDKKIIREHDVIVTTRLT
ncbi:hypothetical protein TIFTF001_020499 [Ficus carica]|uniref:Uncharacterized protein n=1 Tax=Ficus carica TaxID=3494 RepID=A0AA88AIJ4_FICCA|nr:hypothetical protein TIFTF001_020499 [Ficus carica]